MKRYDQLSRRVHEAYLDAEKGKPVRVDAQVAGFLERIIKSENNGKRSKDAEEFRLSWQISNPPAVVYGRRLQEYHAATQAEIPNKSTLAEMDRVFRILSETSD